MKIVRHFFLLIGMGLVVWGSWTCKDDLADKGPIDVTFPDSNVSYRNHVQPLFDRGCAFSGCHGPEEFDVDGYSLDSYDHLMYGTRSVLFRFDADASLLVQSVEGKTGAIKMPPPTFTQLNANQIKGLRTWVLEGAQNN